MQWPKVIAAISLWSWMFWYVNGIKSTNYVLVMRCHEIRPRKAKAWCWLSVPTLLKASPPVCVRTCFISVLLRLILVVTAAQFIMKQIIKTGVSGACTNLTWTHDCRRYQKNLDQMGPRALWFWVNRRPWTSVTKCKLPAFNPFGLFTLLKETWCSGEHVTLSFWNLFA